MERPLETLRPDAELIDDDGSLFIEIYVRHAVDDEKGDRVRALDVRMVEIDLSEFDSGPINDPAGLPDWILHEAPRRWIWLPEATRLLAAERARLAAQFSAAPDDHIHAPGNADPQVAIDWPQLRRSFNARRIDPLTEYQQLNDPRVGCWIWLKGDGAAELIRRLTAGGGVYEARLQSGERRIIYLGRDAQLRRDSGSLP
ncbi:hypothetical protein [Luteibacter sp.]|uniref:hypothetical protein n=1 Tax=Luteibacter sp. TaxID=1886636 RepID=UPI003F7DDA7D